MARRALTEAATAISVAEVSGWELVDYATRLVSTHFETYSVLHPWESAETAFGHRRGYCTQYNGALAIILRELSLDAWLVCTPHAFTSAIGRTGFSATRGSTCD